MKSLMWRLVHLQQLLLGATMRFVLLTVNLRLYIRAEFRPSHARSSLPKVMEEATRTDSTPALPPLQQQNINRFIYFIIIYHVCSQTLLQMTTRGQFKLITILF